MTNILYTFWLMFPAAIANGTPPFLNKLFPKLGYPIDLGKKLANKEVLGPHKTFRGLIGGTLIGFCAFLLQQNLDYFDIGLLPWHYGVILAFSALLGDLLKSFFKRRLNIPAGKSWFPFDQLDWVVFSYPIMMSYGITNISLLNILLLGLILHVLSKVLGYFLKINDTAF